MASDEGFEEWDAEFLDQLIQVEELALCSSSSTHCVSQPVPQQRQEPPTVAVVAGSHFEPISYSPPRELSQRTTAFDPLPRSSNGIAKCAPSAAPAPGVLRSEIDKELEIERLKVRTLYCLFILHPLKRKVQFFFFWVNLNLIVVIAFIRIFTLCFFLFNSWATKIFVECFLCSCPFGMRLVS